MSAYHPTFVSHAHADNDLCDRYVAALRARGIDIWYDRNNAQAGHFLDREIEQQLEQRSAFVLLMTQQALDSFWVQQELGAYRGLMGQERSRLLLPVRIGPCHVPPLLNALLWIDALAMPFDQAIDAIATALAIQGAAASPSAPSPPIRDTMPPLGPAPAAANSAPADYLTPMSLYNLGFRGYSVNGVDSIVPSVCAVAAGEFLMGSDKHLDPQAYDDEEPQHRVTIAAYFIARFPVTVAEYACFVEAAYHRQPNNWEHLMQTLDHPVTYVSWEDAVAYATWLTKSTGQLWRLPSEAEWEKAARWDKRNGVACRYPWGDIFDLSRANTGESGQNGTSVVGSYPSGASPSDAEDMAGNVREWTHSLFKPYPYIGNDGREVEKSTGDRVLRGGSWDDGQRYVRAACRDYGRPSNLSDATGFRLLLAGTGSA
ncbi:MAG TPA: SUMF1/EgtB/PvdO family nonheme iron enzyme [Ktedonobacterales bacterium]|jgi:formylglycine-generating enzyme required for sulfatase activity